LERAKTESGEERRKKAAYRSVGNLLVERYKISTRHATKIECVFHNKNSVKITVFLF